MNSTIVSQTAKNHCPHCVKDFSSWVSYNEHMIAGKHQRTYVPVPKEKLKEIVDRVDARLAKFITLPDVQPKVVVSALKAPLMEEIVVKSDAVSRVAQFEAALGF